MLKPFTLTYDAQSIAFDDESFNPWSSGVGKGQLLEALMSTNKKTRRCIIIFTHSKSKNTNALFVLKLL